MAVCAVCLVDLEERGAAGAGDMLFHPGCLPRCRFCERRYDPAEAGWDFRGAADWSDQHGYLQRLESAACSTCTDDAERRDYGSGW